jgi:hypothetical protein
VAQSSKPGSAEIAARSLTNASQIINKYIITDKPNLNNNKESLSRVLQGQCHEMVVEIRPWGGRLALN